MKVLSLVCGRGGKGSFSPQKRVLQVTEGGIRGAQKTDQKSARVSRSPGYEIILRRTKKMAEDGCKTKVPAVSIEMFRGRAKGFQR